MFQQIIVNQFIAKQNQNDLKTAFDKLSAHFHNPQIQQNIRNSNEIQYQSEFIRNLFVNVFGFILNPEPNFNLKTEQKNKTNAKKADGAIFKDDKVVAVIELKGTDTTDLGSVETQAFGYKNNQPNCRYVITSNFQKLRFYIDNAVEYLEFNLFKLKFDEFKLLYLLLNNTNLLSDLPLKLKSESISQEEKITKQLYKNYSKFKLDLFHDICENNSTINNQQSTINNQQSTINNQQSTINNQQSTINRIIY